MTNWAAQGAELVEREGEYVCERCDLKCELWQWPDDGRAVAGMQWFYCPCCRCRIRTPDQIEASAKKRMAELGMTEEEYNAHARSFINTDPLPPDVLEGMHEKLKDMERDWKPTCEHDTENPFGKGSTSGEEEAASG